MTECDNPTTIVSHSDDPIDNALVECDVCMESAYKGYTVITTINTQFGPRQLKEVLCRRCFRQSDYEA